MPDNFYYWLFGSCLFFLWLWVRQVRQNIATMQEEMKKILDSILFMRVEKHNDTLFAFNALNDEFICQGESLEELNKKFGQRYPKCKGIIVEPTKPKGQND